jgi:hypothetical protein
MSVDPVAGGATGSAVALEALIAAELNALAADAQALQGQVTAGQVVTAQVLPPNGLTDLISILGNRVAASLPPTLSPGDVFTAQVTGFNGPQILLQVLDAAPPLAGGETPPPGTSEVPLEAAPTPFLAAATRPLPEGVTPSVAPPPAVFVAASVRPSPAVPGEPAPATALAGPPSAQPLASPVVLADIEARLAAARTGQIGVNVPGPASAAPPAAPPAPAVAAAAPPPPNVAPAPSAGAAPSAPNAVPAAPPAPAGAPAPPLPSRFTLPPQIVPSARFGDAQSAPASTTAAGGGAAAATSVASYRDPAALVRALGLPVTPSNVAAAKLALDTPQRLPAALATLESALPQSDDPRVATLRTLTAWLGKIEPGSPQLAEQISAYVDNVVTGNEPKLVQLLTAQLAAEQPSAPPAAAAGEDAAAPGAPAAPVPEPAVQVLALAMAAERGAALNVDLKTQLLSLVNAPPAGTEAADDLVPAASSALSAVTAVQMNAAQSLAATPQTMSFSLPLWLGSNYAQARIAIDRDAPESGGKGALDGDNFHIAFILDTKNLGTVSVDLQTVGRAFSLAVKTENEGTAQRFADSLDRLTGRLQTLRYRVNSAEATVAPRGTAALAAAGAASTPAPADVDDGIPSDVNVRA